MFCLLHVPLCYYFMSALLFSLFTCCNCLIRGLQSAPSQLMYLLTFGLIIYVWKVSAEWWNTQDLSSNLVLNSDKPCKYNFSQNTSLRKDVHPNKNLVAISESKNPEVKLKNIFIKLQIYNIMPHSREKRMQKKKRKGNNTSQKRK